jgi:hypothetical protein
VDKTPNKSIDFIYLERSGSSAVRDWLKRQFVPVAFLHRNRHSNKKATKNQINIVQTRRQVSHKFGSDPRTGKSDRKAPKYPTQPVPANKVRIFIIRSLQNHTASLVQQASDRYPYDKRFVDEWVFVAKHFTGAYYAKEGGWTGRHNIFIKFDEWFVSEDYRKDIVRQLADLGYDVEFSNKGIKQFHSPGTPFNDWEDYENATKLPLTKRWKQVNPHELVKYWTEEAIRLNKEIFGPMDIL